MPMPLSYGRVLKLPNGPQACQHILDGRLELYVSVPGSHFLVEETNVLGELLTLNVHVLNVDLSPRGCLPIFDARLHNENVIPELL